MVDKLEFGSCDERTLPKHPGLIAVQCCHTSALRCRLSTTMALVQALLKFMGVRNPLLLICPWEGTVSALNHETASWCTCVFLGGLPWSCSELWDLRSQSRAKRLWRQELNRTSHIAVEFPVGNLISPPETMAMRKTRVEERTQVMLGWMQLCCSGGKGCTSVCLTLGLQNQQLAAWAGLAGVPESTAFTLSSFSPLPCKAVPLKLSERWGFVLFGFFLIFFFVVSV